ncbi:PLP-dependent aminotransferase family protein [Leucothrix sargassi]|nr:PLP-dependent aminotransferase family protein [Leucothrix sargassi]
MRYKAIVEQLVEDIQQDKLSYGQRMPSLRNLAAQFGVSMTTALNSYRSLEAMGWVIARPQSGFFVSSPIRQGSTPHQPQFRSKVASASDYQRRLPIQNIKRSGPLGLSQLAPKHLPTKALQRSMKRGLQALGSSIHAYPNAQGLETLRVALSDHFTESGLPLSADELVISSGCIDAVRMALSVVTQPNDGVAISSPCFNGLLELLSAMNRKVIEIPCTDEGIDLKQLETHIKNGDVVAGLFSSCNLNPHGISLDVSQKQRLAELANTYQLPIIEDDVYIELGYDKALPLPIKYWDKGGYVLWCGSLSKTLSAGVRLGWCAAGRYKEAMISESAVSKLGQDTVVQAGVEDFIRSGEYRKHVVRIRTWLFANVCAYRALLAKHLPDNAAISQPTGGIVLWIQVPNLDINRFSKALDEAHIDIRLGSLFTTRRLYQDYFRVSAGWLLSDVCEDGKTVEALVVELCWLVCQATRSD